jgi:hypothetical protein
MHDFWPLMPVTSNYFQVSFAQWKIHEKLVVQDMMDGEGDQPHNSDFLDGGWWLIQVNSSFYKNKKYLR